MTGATENIILSRDQLRNLLATARSNDPVDEPDFETADYDWKRPHQFNDSHRIILSQFGNQLATGLGDEFTDACNDPSVVTISPVTEYYCNGLKEEYCNGKSNCYIVIIDENNRQVGVLLIPHLSAVQWASKMLGDTTPEVTEEYEMSNLEESLLVDLCNDLIKKLSETMEKNELKSVRSQGVLTSRDWPVESLDYEEYTQMQLQVQHTEGTGEASLFILSSLLGQISGIGFADESQTNSMEVRNAVIASIKKIPLEVDVLLGSANISMSTLMNLSKGDVIVLDRKTYEPLDAIIEERVFFHGFPVRTLHRYAISVTDVIMPGEALKIN